MMLRHETAPLRVAVITSSFNEFITKKLYSGAIEALKEEGIDADDIMSVWVPGAFELPLALAEVAEQGYDAAVCLGTVIRGETSHFDFVAGEAARGIASISVAKRLPVGFGVITSETTDQALERAGGKRGNKGREAALAAVEMARTVFALRSERLDPSESR